MPEKRPLPAFLRAKYQLIATVTFTAFFSVVFLLVSIPFSHNVWFGLGDSYFFLFTVLFALAGLFIVIVSKVVMYKTRHVIPMDMPGYVLWNVCEIVLICLLYTILTISITGQDRSEFVPIFFSSLVYGTISLAIPYIIAGMYFAILDKNNTIRLMDYQNVVSDEAIAPTELKKITLFDNSGVMKMSVNSSNLYYIESDDNYIKVWYTDSKNELKTYMVRCRLKTVEESFLGSGLVRCHRKYIVNMDKVRVMRKEAEGYELVLDNDSIAPIPVTKTYTDTVLGYFKEIRRD